MNDAVSRSALLHPAPGPADPPSSRPRAGVLGGAVHSFQYDPSLGEQRVVLGAEFRIRPGTVVHWAFYADGPDAVHAPHAALAVSIDVVLDDGSRVGDDARVRDRYGFGLAAQAQFTAAWALPEQWNADTVAIGQHAGRDGRVEVVLGAGPDPDVAPRWVTGFVEVLVDHRPERPGAADSPAERVDTRRGSHAGPRFSRGNTIPITAAPHGFCFLTPATDAGDSRWPYRPSVHDDPAGRRLEAVQFSHQPSPWIGDHGILQLAPFAGRPHSDRRARRRWIVPGTERARPHVYAADLDGGLALEVTATEHGGAFRVRAADPEGRVGFVFDQLTGEGGLQFADDGGSFGGWVPEGGTDWGNPPRTYFAGRAAGVPLAHGPLEDAGRKRVAGHITAEGALEVRIALSYLSVDQARRTLAAELGEDRSFEEIRDGLRDRWDALLAAVQVPAPTDGERPFRALAHEEDAARIASALYRLHLYPTRMDEDAGTPGRPEPRFADATSPAGPHGEERTGAPIRSGVSFVTNGYWDTYRTAWPALALLDPDATAGLLDGLLQQWRGGGWMARWSAPGYVDCMVGTSSDQIFADAAARGVRFDGEAGFESAWRNACEPSADPRTGRKGIAAGRFTGWIPWTVTEGMSWSIENAIADAGIAFFAEALTAMPRERRGAFARYFRNRSLSYRRLFDPQSGFFRGRDAQGALSPEPFDPRVWGGDYVETNAWGMSVSAVHDGDGLAALYGGSAGLRAHLDRLFAEPETADPALAGAYGTVIHEQREARALRAGMCGISNQPAHHIPWMHVFGDEPWRAGAEAAALARRLFTGAMIGQGFPGDEDNGEMSAWWLWAAIGLYPLELGSGELRIGAPLLDDVTIRRADGRALRIRTRRDAPDAAFLVEARLDGTPLDRAVLDVRLLDRRADADLELVLTADRAKAAAATIWRRPEPAPIGWCADLTGPVAVPGAECAGVAGGTAIGSVPSTELFADGADTAVALAAGDTAGWRFPEPTTVTDVTLTAVEAVAPGALRWEASSDGSSWAPVATTHVETLPADRTTPFSLMEPTTVRMLRVRATVPVVLRQIELFDLGEDRLRLGEDPQPPSDRGGRQVPLGAQTEGAGAGLVGGSTSVPG